MGMLDKAMKAVQGRSGAIEQGIDKAAAQIDRRTKGKYSDKLAKGADAVKSRARQMDRQRAATGETDHGRAAAGETEHLRRPTGDVTGERPFTEDVTGEGPVTGEGDARP